ncbi:MAG: hypothetical protein AAFR66_02160 [Bacteroidota bacterium]
MGVIPFILRADGPTVSYELRPSHISGIYERGGEGRRKCHSGKFTSSRRAGACAWHGGVYNNCAKAELPGEVFAVWFPVERIFTDTDRFQNREKEFSEDSVRRILTNFDINRLDPVVLWEDPRAGKVFMLSGHSRLEAFIRKKEAHIPARFFLGTEAEAMRFSRVDANRLGTPESLLEEIEAYKLDRDGDERRSISPLDKTLLKDKWKRSPATGYSLNELELFSYLNAKGKFLETLNTPARKNFPYIENKAKWIGQFRKAYPALSNFHEDEAFDFLFSEVGIKLSKDQIFEILNRIVGALDFDPTKPLNLKQDPNRGIYARKDTSGIMQQIKALEDEQAALRTRRRNAQTRAEKEVINQQLTRIGNELLQLQKGVEQVVKNQATLFN